MIKHVNGWQLNRLKSSTNRRMTVRPFPTATSRCIQDYIKPTLEQKPDAIILRVGTNDLTSDKEANSIARDIVNIAGTCKNRKTEVIISEIISRAEEEN